MQVDLMQAVSYLSQRPEVDSHRIAVLGYSMGAFVSGIAGAIDPRIHAVLLSGGGTYDDENDVGKSFDRGKLPCQAPPWRSLRVLGSAPHMRGAVIYALNADRGAMLVENGSADEVMDIPHRGPEWFADLRERAIALRKTDRNLFTTHVDATMGHRPAWVERAGVLWLNDQIHFANWNTSAIAEMPVTRIGDWAKANGVEIPTNYQRNDREAGLMALGGALPRIERDQLMVLSAIPRTVARRTVSIPCAADSPSGITCSCGSPLRCRVSETHAAVASTGSKANTRPGGPTSLLSAIAVYP